MFSSREEKFFTLSVDVKNKESVEEALALYVKGELLDGENKYNCAVRFITEKTSELF